MLGRTHLQDATPVTLGQVIGGWVAQLDERVATSSPRRDALYPLALGGTAVGTGLNAPTRFGRAVAAELALADRQAVRARAGQVRGAVGARRRSSTRSARRAHARRRR